MADVTDVRDAQLFSGDVLVVDTSVWLLLYATSLGGTRYGADQYSSLLEEARARSAQVLITDEVVNEYVNRRVKDEMEHCDEARIKGSDKDRRDAFRRTSAWHDVIEALGSELVGITSLAKVVRSPLAGGADLPKVLGDYAREPLDWTDLGLARLAMAQNAKLVTHDRDFCRCSFDLEVISLQRA